MSTKFKRAIGRVRDMEASVVRGDAFTRQARAKRRQTWQDLAIAGIVAFAVAFTIASVTLGFLRQAGSVGNLLWNGLRLMAGLGVAWLVVRWRAGLKIAADQAANDDEFISGVRLVSPTKLAEDVRANPDGGASPYFLPVFRSNDCERVPENLIHLPLPARRESLNVLYSGVTGSGKTNAAKSLMQQVIDRGVPFVALDPKPELVTHWYDGKKRVLYCPFDRRSIRWDFWGEVQKIYHPKMFADALIPEERGGSPYWYLGSRIIFADAVTVLKRQGATEIADLFEVLCLWQQDDLFRLLAGTASEKFLDPEKRSSRELHSSLISRAQFLSYFPRGGNKVSFSQWTEAQEKGSAIFLTSTEEIAPSVNNTYALVLEIMVRRRLSLPDTGGREALVLGLEELPSIGQLPVARALFTRARSKGVWSVVLNQEEALLDMLYGPEVARAIRGALQTKIIMHHTDDTVAEKYSRDFGKGWYWQRGRSEGVGAEAGGETISHSYNKQRIEAVSMDAILRCRQGDGYLLFPDDYMPSYVRFPEFAGPKVAEDFVPRDDLTLASTPGASVATPSARRPAHETDMSGLPTQADLAEAIDASQSSAQPPDPLLDEPWDGR